MANIILRLSDESKASYEVAAKGAGVSLSEWIRRLADAACGIAPKRQVPIKPGVDVEVEPLPEIPKSEKQVAFDPAKGEVTVEPVVGVSTGKTRPFDPNGGPVTVEPIPGLKNEPKQKAYDPKGGNVRVEPVKTYDRSHHPRCDCLMCKGDKKSSEKPVSREPELGYTGETTKFKGRIMYEINTETGKRWTATPPPGK